MRPLICPQCGGQITEYEPGATFTVCEYCSTRFLIEENKQPRTPPVFVEPPDLGPPDSAAPFVRILGLSIGAIAVVVVLALVLAKSGTTSNGYSISSTPSKTVTTVKTPVPTPTPDAALLRFPVQDAARGQLAESEAIAVDPSGAIYVGDDKLRVQQFDANGNFVRMMTAPEKGRNYERARNINKIAVDTSGKTYVAVGGVILVYGKEWKGVQRVIHVAPDYIQDFVLRPDGSMLAVSVDDRVETLLFINKAGGVSKRIRGFHTDALRSSMSPLETAAESVRIAVAGDGSIYSLYALGALGSYSLSIGDGDLRVAKFTPEGKFQKAFAPSPDSRGIYVDSTDRLIVSDTAVVKVLDGQGAVVTGLPSISSLTALALSENGEVYTLADNAVAKWRLTE